MTQKSISYTEAELAWIKANSRKPRAAMHAAFCKKFDRNDISLKQISALCIRKHWLTGRYALFQKSNVPQNNITPLHTTKFTPSNANERRPKLKGFERGHVPHNTRPVGYERITSDGYVTIKVAITSDRTGPQHRFALKHLWLWEQAYGSVPDGMCLKCVGDRLNTDPSNWELIPRKLLGRLNGKSGRGYDAAPAELKPIIMAVTKLEHRIRNAKGAEI